MPISTVLLIVALVLAVVAALPIPTGPFNLGWAAFAFFLASELFR